MKPGLRALSLQNIISLTQCLILYGKVEHLLTVNEAKIRITEEKSPVGAPRKSAKILDFQRIGLSWGLSGRFIGRVDGQKH